MVQEDWKCDGHREDHAGGGVEDYSRMEIFTGMGARCDSENVLSYDTKSSFYRNSKTSRNEENKSRGRHGSPELRNGRLIMGKKKMWKVCRNKPQMYCPRFHDCWVMMYKFWPLTTRGDLPGVSLSLKCRQKVFQIHWSILFLCSLL